MLVGASIAALFFVGHQHRSARLAGSSVDGSLRLAGRSGLRRGPKEPDAADHPGAVKRGVLSLVLLDAALATAFVGIGYGLVLLAAALGAVWLGRAFSVT